MGAYFKAVLLKADRTTIDKFSVSWDYNDGAKLKEHSYIGKEFVSAFESMLFQKKQRVVWACDNAPNCKLRRTKVYHRCTDDKLVKPTVSIREIHRRFIINHTKKIYIDKSKLKPNPQGLTIHPLPLLTAEAQGIVENYGIQDDKIGTWARNVIEVNYEAPKGYKEVEFNMRNFW
jgi:hypothetical protein